MIGNPIITISIDHVKSLDLGTGEKRPIIWWGSYIKGDKKRADLWGTGKWWMESPGLHGADDPLLQGPNFAVKRDGTDLVAHYLGFDLFWGFEEDVQIIRHSIADIDEELSFLTKHPKYLDSTEVFGGWFFEKTDRWPDWKTRADV